MGLYHEHRTRQTVQSTTPPQNPDTCDWCLCQPVGGGGGFLPGVRGRGGGFLPGVGGGVWPGGQGGRPARGEEGGVRVRVTELVEPVLVL